MYRWRKMDEKARADLLQWRKENKHPWHSPQHRSSKHTHAWMFTAACFEHAPRIGQSEGRMAAFEDALLTTVRDHSVSISAWAVMPNHYHILATTSSAPAMLTALGKLHGRLSKEWNDEENMRGRQVWYRAAETGMKTERHFWATMNYIHHNPVKHHHAARWQDWPYSSARLMLQTLGREAMIELWREYPIDDYGKGWDD